MYESHASYSDCALMGHGMTDRIVAAAEKLGPRAGFYGAKITGGGCGGTVALFIKDTPDVHQRVEMLISEYTQTTGRSTMLFVGSGPGAAELGAHKLSHVDLV
jgi:L-arabinokinase